MKTNWIISFDFKSLALEIISLLTRFSRLFSCYRLISFISPTPSRSQGWRRFNNEYLFGELLMIGGFIDEYMLYQEFKLTDSRAIGMAGCHFIGVFAVHLKYRRVCCASFDKQLCIGFVCYVMDMNGIHPIYIYNVRGVYRVDWLLMLFAWLWVCWWSACCLVQQNAMQLTAAVELNMLMQTTSTTTSSPVECYYILLEERHTQEFTHILTSIYIRSNTQYSHQ